MCASSCKVNKSCSAYSTNEIKPQDTPLSTTLLLGKGWQIEHSKKYKRLYFLISPIEKRERRVASGLLQLFFSITFQRHHVHFCFPVMRAASEIQATVLRWLVATTSKKHVQFLKRPLQCSVWKNTNTILPFTRYVWVFNSFKLPSIVYTHGKAVLVTCLHFYWSVLKTVFQDMKNSSPASETCIVLQSTLYNIPWVKKVFNYNNNRHSTSKLYNGW